MCSSGHQMHQFHEPRRTSTTTNLLLIREVAEVLVVRVPRNEVCVSGTQFRILLVARDFSLLEPEASVNAKRLIVEVPGKHPISDNSKLELHNILKVFSN